MIDLFEMDDKNKKENAQLPENEEVVAENNDVVEVFEEIIDSQEVAEESGEEQSDEVVCLEDDDFLTQKIDEIAEERSDIKVCKINTDEQEELAIRFGIMSIPTLIVFKNGEITKKTMGVQPKAAILGLFE